MEANSDITSGAVRMEIKNIMSWENDRAVSHVAYLPVQEVIKTICILLLSLDRSLSLTELTQKVKVKDAA